MSHLPAALRIMLRLLVPLLVLAFSVPSKAGGGIGVVLMHGKTGRPLSMRVVATALEAAGYAVDLPEMCWSRRRIYDLPYLECLRDIDGAIEQLKSRGAERIIVAGQSLGGNAALAYGARNDWIFGVIALAPAHNPPQISRQPEIAHSLAQARKMIAGGQGDVVAAFVDVRNDEQISIQTTANIYASFLSPDGPAVIQANTARLRVPLLWVAGDADPTQRGPQTFALATNPKNRYVTVSADHMGTPAASRDAVVSWLRELAEGQ